MKRIKVFLLKIKWVLFGGKPYKKAMEEIYEAKGMKVVHKSKRFRPSNGNYESTKRCAYKNNE